MELRELPKHLYKPLSLVFATGVGKTIYDNVSGPAVHIISVINSLCVPIPKGVAACAGLFVYGKVTEPATNFLQYLSQSVDTAFSNAVTYMVEHPQFETVWQAAPYIAGSLAGLAAFVGGRKATRKLTEYYNARQRRVLNEETIPDESADEQNRRRNQKDFGDLSDLR